MSISDEDKSGYVAIGEAVMGQIFDEEEISRESLMLRLTRVAEYESNDHRLLSLSSGRRILSDISDAETRHDSNVVNINALRLATGRVSRRDSPSANDSDARDNEDSDEAGHG